MIRINLLPHREVRRKANQQLFFIFVGIFAVIGIAIWGAVHVVFSAEIDNQQALNKYLVDEIAVLDKQIDEIKKLQEQKEQLLQRKKVVESLQSNRSEVVHLIDQLVRQLPDGVYLRSVRQTGQKVNITGYATSNARVSTLMRNLESSPWLAAPSLVEIKASPQANVRRSEFTLNVTLTRGKVDDGKAGGKPKTGALGIVPAPRVATQRDAAVTPTL